MIRRIRMTLVLTTGAVALLIAVGCVFTRVAVEQVTASPQGTVVRSPLKAHLVDGGTVIFADGATVGPDVVRGVGQRFPLTGGSITVLSAIPLDSVVGMESYQTRTNAVPTVLASAGIVGLSLAAVTALAVAAFGSCPTFYSDSAGVAVLEAEGFSYSIAPLFEQRDVDRLRATAGADGTLRLEVRNEALETHYLNHIALLQTVHDKDETVVPDERGVPIALRNLDAPMVATDKAGRDVRATLARSDGDLFATAPLTLARADAGDLVDYIDVTAARPHGDSLAVMFRLRNSLLNTVLLYEEMLGDPGARSLDWLGRDMQKITSVIGVGKWYSAHMGMRVAVRAGNGEYREVARFTDKGPIAFHDLAVVVPVLESDSVRIRLSFVPDNWRIDLIATSGSFRRPPVTKVPLAALIGRDKAADTAAFNSVESADDRYLVTSPGQYFSARFNVGRDQPGSSRTFFLVSQGYYTEWVRGSWLKKTNTATRPFVAADSTLARAIASWRGQQQALERDFYSSRIPTR